MPNFDSFFTPSAIRFRTVFITADPPAPTDPTEVHLWIEDPLGNITSYTQADLVHESLGTYFLDRTLDVSGVWTYRWQGTGTVEVSTPDMKVVMAKSRFSFRNHKKTIVGITLSANTFTGSVPSGTIIGSIAILITGGSFTGSLSLTGASAASFRIVGLDLVTNGILTSGVYPINIVATQIGALESPFTSPETVTGIVPVVVNAQAALSGNASISSTAQVIPTTTNAQAILRGIGSVNLKAAEISLGRSLLAGTSSLRGSATVISAGATQLATQVFVNTTGSSIAAGAFSPQFGWPFKKGDIPAGTYPIWRDRTSGVNQPYSYGLVTYWDDGSWKWASFWFCTTYTHGASATRLIDLYSGGGAPGTSGLTLTDVYNQGVIVGAVGLGGTVSGANISGTWNGYLRSDSNNVQSYQYMDGDAGAAFYIDTQMAQTPGGTPDAWLCVEHYVLALNDSGGSLAALRWHGAIHQPIYNSGSNIVNRAFSSLTLSVNGGAGLGVAFPFTPSAYTVDGSGNATTNSANDFWCGGGLGGNEIPCYLTGISGGSPLDSNTIYYISDNVPQTGPIDNTVVFADSGYNAGTFTIHPAAGGTGTINPCLMVTPFSRLQFMNTDGKYIFFLAGATATSADYTLRSQIDKPYWASSRVIPPFDLSLSPADVPDTPFFGSWAAGHNVLWNPYNIGDFFRYQGSAGDHGDIGVIPIIAGTDFYNQSNDSDRLVRYVGLAAGLYPYDLRDATTRTILNLNNVSYTGMPASVATTISYGGLGGGSSPPFYPGVQAAGGFNMGFDDNIPEHKPQFSFWAYIRTGELQYLKSLTETANGGLLFANNTVNMGASRNLSLTFGGFSKSYTAVAIAFIEGNIRDLAWAFRDIILAAGIYPYDPTNATYLPLDGSKLGQYFRDIVATNLTFLIDAMTVANGFYGAATAFTVARGMYIPLDGAGNYVIANYGYMIGYFGQVLCLAPSLLESADGKTCLGIYSTRYNWISSNFGTWHIMNYGQYDGVDAGGGQCSITGILADADHWAVGGDAIGLTWSTSGPPYFTIGATSYTPQNGDKVITVFGTAGLTAYQPYYFINYNSGTRQFDLCTTKGGSTPFVPASNGSGSDFIYALNSNPATGGITANSADYFNIHAAVTHWMRAIGGITPDITAVDDDLAGRLTAGGWNTATSGARYAFQIKFGP